MWRGSRGWRRMKFWREWRGSIKFKNGWRGSTFWYGWRGSKNWPASEKWHGFKYLAI